MLTTSPRTALGSGDPSAPAPASASGSSAERGSIGFALLVDDKGDEEVRRRSWGWCLAAVAAAVVVALGLAACGDDDDGAETGDTAGGAGAEVSLNLGYVTTAEHPYGIALDQFVTNWSSAIP